MSDKTAAPGRPITRPGRVRVHIELDPEVAKALRAQARKAGKPQWQIVQEALQRFF